MKYLPGQSSANSSSVPDRTVKLKNQGILSLNFDAIGAKFKMYEISCACMRRERGNT